MKKLALILAVLFLFSTPALATSVDDLISELESELTAVPDLSSAFGSVGEAQGEVFATGVITGERSMRTMASAARARICCSCSRAFPPLLCWWPSARARSMCAARPAF